MNETWKVVLKMEDLGCCRQIQEKVKHANPAWYENPANKAIVDDCDALYRWLDMNQHTNVYSKVMRDRPLGEVNRTMRTFKGLMDMWDACEAKSNAGGINVKEFM